MRPHLLCLTMVLAGLLTASCGGDSGSSGAADVGVEGDTGAGNADASANEDASTDNATDTTEETPEPWPGWCTRERDNGADGELDERVTQEWNAEGLRTLLSGDLDADGAPDQIEAWSYTPEGWMETHDIDEEGDGVFDERRRWTWTPEGLEETTTIDLGIDGVDDEITRYTYDTRGLLTETTTDGSADGLVPIPPDGTIDLRITSTWDDMERPLRTETDRSDDGTIDRLETWSHDGETTSVLEIDTENDGVVNQRVTLTVEANELGGVDSLTAIDGFDRVGNDQVLNADGLNEREQLERYDSEGRLIERVGTTFSINIDGVHEANLELREEFTYNDAGLNIAYSRAFTDLRDPFGDPYDRLRTTATYDEVGNILRTETDTEADGQFGDGDVDRVTTYTYSCWE